MRSLSPLPWMVPETTRSHPIGGRLHQVVARFGLLHFGSGCVCMSWSWNSFADRASTNPWPHTQANLVTQDAHRKTHELPMFSEGWGGWLRGFIAKMKLRTVGWEQAGEQKDTAEERSGDLLDIKDCDLDRTRVRRACLNSKSPDLIGALVGRAGSFQGI